jgi:hypothetical protein|tara:strand:- start:5329 stop:6156 length:828 start_codon:yes stop_codon:yes gene_type:complete
MNLLFKTKGEALTLMIEVATNGPQKIQVEVKDLNKANTYYTNRHSNINGTDRFFVRMPLSPYESLISIYNKTNGNLKQGQDPTFKVVKVDARPLDRKLDCVNWENPKIRDFVHFAQQFSENSGILSAGKFPNGSTYISDEGNFRIDYFDDIRTKRGLVIQTPARISQSKGIIQVSRVHFDKFTVPMRMAILLHEFSHYYLNENMEDETEADLNGLLIYLSLGYPRIEAYQSFLTTFKDTPTPQNKERFDILHQFITNFERNKFCTQYNTPLRARK